jgi:uncharacterized membrane protein
MFNIGSIGKYAIMLLLIIVGIYTVKWINSQFKIPVVGEMVEAV